MRDHRTELESSLQAKLTAASGRPLPKRFYANATAAAGATGHRLLLDGRPAKTPKRREIAVASEDLAQAIAAEWAAQTVHIDPATMPVTTLVCSALDTVADHHATILAEVVAYAGSDLLCYRADGPDRLVALQAQHWDGPLVWAEAALGARFVRTTGLMPVAQPSDAQDAIRAAIAPLAALPLAAVHVLTTLTGSAVLAIAVARGALDMDALWAAAHVDEDWQIAQWGEDAQAAARRAARRREADAAALVLRHKG